MGVGELQAVFGCVAGGGVEVMFGSVWDFESWGVDLLLGDVTDATRGGLDTVREKVLDHLAMYAGFWFRLLGSSCFLVQEAVRTPSADDHLRYPSPDSAFKSTSIEHLMLLFVSLKLLNVQGFALYKRHGKCLLRGADEKITIFICYFAVYIRQAATVFPSQFLHLRVGFD